MTSRRCRRRSEEPNDSDCRNAGLRYRRVCAHARYRTRRQTESHRTPRYRVRFQLEGQPAHEAMVGPNPRQYLVEHLRGSKPGDFVKVKLSEDGKSIVDWVNRTDEEFWRNFDATYG
jgi:hypothetical protein